MYLKYSQHLLFTLYLSFSESNLLPMNVCKIAAFRGVRSGSTLLAQACLSKYVVNTKSNLTPSEIILDPPLATLQLCLGIVCSSSLLSMHRESSAL